MNLYPITLGELSYVECGQFIIRVLTDITETGTDVNVDLDVKQMYDSLMAQSIVYNNALLKIRAKEESLLLAILDTQRDKKIATLRRMHAVAEYSDDAAEKKAYDIIEIVLRKYEKIELLNFEAQSLSIDKLVGELNTTEYNPFATTIGLLPHVVNLETANNNFKTTFNARAVKTIGDEVFDTKKIKRDILISYREFADYSKLMANRRNTDYYSNLLKVVNNGREYFANIIARRNGGTPPPTPA